MITYLIAVCLELSAPIYVTSDNVVLSDESYSLAKGADCPMIVVGDYLNEEPSYVVRNVILRNLYLNGKRDYQTKELHNSFLRNNCITVRGCVNVVIENVVVCYARSGGVVIEKGSSNILINGLNSYNCFFDGFASCASNSIKLINSSLHSNDYAGISLDWRADSNYFYNLSLDGNGHCGIFMRDSNYNTFQSINFSYSGIYIAKRWSRDDGCHYNLFYDFNTIPIYVGDSCEGNIFIRAKK